MRYNDKLKHPLWQKKRLKIMERDGFMCAICGNPVSELHVHHCYYDNSIKNPWEYPDKALITLCDNCHKDNHNSKIGAHALIILKALCRLTNQPHLIAVTLQREIKYNISVCEMTENEAIKKAFLELIKPA